MNSISTIDPKELFEEYKTDPSEDKRNQIVEYYLPIVKIIIKRYLGKGVDEDDLYQVGAMAMVRAVERFDSDLGYDFKSFATPTIIGEIKRYFRDKGWAVHIPSRIKDLAIRIDSEREDFHLRNGRQPTVSDLAENLSATEEEILSAMESRQNYRAYSLDQAMENQSADGDSSSAPIEKYTGTNEDGYGEIESVEFIQSLMKKLPDREQLILKDKLLGGKTQREMAEILGVSQMTISRLESDIREKFKKEYFK